MCLLVFAVDFHPKYSFVLAANRDEFYNRPTAAATFWKDHQGILAGRDLKAQGTWMGVHKNGRFAAVTNYRDPEKIRDTAKSRGDIPVNFLVGNSSSEDYFQTIDREANNYNGFNALIGNEKGYFHYSNYERKINKITPGVYGLSNALLDSPWPKVEALKADFSKIISSDFESSDLLEMLSNTQTYPESDLPKTGVPIDLEKALSAICIRLPHYGTCCSTLILIDREGVITFVEKTYPVGNRQASFFETNFKISYD